MSAYLETYNAVLRRRRDDYRRATAREITWREYVRKWGI
jgi:hypothetical protein